MWEWVPFDGALLEGVDDLPVVAELTDEAFLSTQAAAENVGAGKLDYLGQVGSQFPINHLQGGGRIQMTDGTAHLCHNCRVRLDVVGSYSVILYLCKLLWSSPSFQINETLVTCCLLTVYQIIYFVHSEAVSSLCLLVLVQVEKNLSASINEGFNHSWQIPIKHLKLIQFKLTWFNLLQSDLLQSPPELLPTLLPWIGKNSCFHKPFK